MVYFQKIQNTNMRTALEHIGIVIAGKPNS